METTNNENGNDNNVTKFPILEVYSDKSFTAHPELTWGQLRQLGMELVKLADLQPVNILTSLPASESNDHGNL